MSLWVRIPPPAPGHLLVRGAVLAAFVVLALPASAARYCGDVAGAIDAARELMPIDREGVSAFYDSMAGACAWDSAGATALIATLRSAGDHGLDPAIFHGDLLADSGGVGNDADRDVVLTDGALKYAVAMTRGLSAALPDKADLAKNARPNGDIIDALAAALEQGTVVQWLSDQAPRSNAYVRMVGALGTYRSIAEAGGWEQIPEGLTNKRKSRHIPTLRRRLALEGDLSFDDGSVVYDDGLRAAVVRFQERNGLRADGKLTAKTIEKLNVSAAERVAQLSLNLERLRLVARDLPQTRVEVNAPAATAVLYRDGAVQLAMNAVVGAPGHDTPTLRSTIDTIIVNPTWTVPQSIIQNEIKPALKRNRDYLEQNRMYWAGDQLVQEPGPHNALGRIKFDFPNRYSVYLHDTPARRLFLDPERAQSHGCVRLERPLDLAIELLSGDPDWDREAIEQAIREGATRRLALSVPMPVVITYQTAFVGEDGLVNFRPDIYGLDTQLTLALSQRAEAMRAEPAQW